MKTAVAYIRVSKEKEDGISPSTQIAKIRDYCKANDWQLIDVYRDIDISGRRIANRKGFQMMLERVQEGGIDYVVTYRLDRFARSLPDFVNTYETLRKHGTEFISVNERFDTSTPMGRGFLYLAALFAQME